MDIPGLILAAWNVIHVMNYAHNYWICPNKENVVFMYSCPASNTYTLVRILAVYVQNYEMQLQPFFFF